MNYVMHHPDCIQIIQEFGFQNQYWHFLLCIYWVYSAGHSSSSKPRSALFNLRESYNLAKYKQDWKAVQRCASKTDHLPIWINTKYTIKNLRYWITKLETNTFLTILNRYIFQFETNKFCNLRQIHFSI